MLNIFSSKLKSLPKKLEKYAEEHDVSELKLGFSDYNIFGFKLVGFLENKNIDSNRAVFIDADFGIITDIFNLSMKIEESTEFKDKVIKLTGGLLTVYLEMLLYSWNQFKEKYNECPLNIVITVNSIRLSNCTSSDTEEESSSIKYHFENICIYMDGLLNYIKEKGLKNSDITV